MKARDSGMADEVYWESLVDPEGTLVALGIDASIADAVEVGCGRAAKGGRTCAAVCAQGGPQPSL